MMKKMKFIKKSVGILGAIILFSSSTSLVPSNVNAAVTIDGIGAKAGELLWSDEFDGSTIDKAKWDNSSDLYGLRGWASTIWTYYEPQYAKVEDGNLVITSEFDYDVSAERSVKNSAYRSAMLSTKNLVNIQYGRIDIRAKFPAGQGICSYGFLFNGLEHWADDGEIDIFENGGLLGTSTIAQALFNKRFSELSEANTSTVHQLTVPTATSEYHLYSIAWNRDKIDYYIDGQYQWTYDPEKYASDGKAIENEELWPFHKPLYLTLCCHVGGHTGGIVAPEGWTKVSSTGDIETYQDYMYVDYVRVYSLAENRNSTQEQPAKVKIKNVKRTKKSIVVKFQKTKNATKYQIQYATNKKFQKAKTKSTKKNTYTIKKVDKKKTYFIRVRGLNGKKKGAWSNVKSVSA